jgi:ABC-2 type transport system permease protein
MHTLKSIGILWYREVLRYWRDRARIVSSLGAPFFFLFVFGSGLTPAMGGLAPDELAGSVSYIQFLFPGTVAMTVLFTSIFTGTSIVWDREFGFLKEVLVAPIGRTAVALGKILGGSTVAMLQGTLMLAFAPLVGVPLTVGLVLRLWPLMFVTAFALTALGVAIAVRMHSLEGFQMIMNFLNVPMLFLSGAFFPLRDLPVWLAVLVRVNPFTYAVDALRQVVLQSLGFSDPARQALIVGGLGSNFLNRSLSTGDDVLLIVLFGISMTVIGAWMFSRGE